jgi:hypothetical protein
MSSDRKTADKSGGPANELTTVLSLECVGTIQRLHWVQKWSLRKVAKHSCISRKTVKKSLFSPPHLTPRAP